MSLNFDVTKCNLGDDYKWLAKADDPTQGIKKGDELMHPVTNALIWGCMGIGIGKITAENYEEWYGRFELQERLFSRSLLKSDGTHYVITLADVKAHIGLTTNVFPKRSDAEFLKQLRSTVVEEAVRKEKMAAERAEAKAPASTKEETKVDG